MTLPARKENETLEEWVRRVAQNQNPPTRESVLARTRKMWEDHYKEMTRGKSLGNGGR